MNPAYNVSLSNRCKKFLGFKCFRDWLEDCRVFLSGQTFMYYADSLADFFVVVGLNPDQFLKIKDKEKVVRRYCVLKLQQGVGKNFVLRSLIPIKSFLRFHGFEYNFKFPIRKEYKFYDKIPTKEELSKILNVCKSLSTKIAIHFLAYAGLRLEDVCNLTYSNIKQDFEVGIVPCSVFVPQNKTGNVYVTFIPPQTVKLLREYFRFRRERYGETLTDNSPILLDHHKAVKGVFKGIRRKTLTGKLERLFKKSGVVLVEQWGTKIRKLRPYSLRKYFRSKLTGYVPPEILEGWMGHISGLAQIYSGQRDLDPETIKRMREIYKENMKHFVVEEIEIEKIVELEERLSRMEETMKMFILGKISKKNVEEMWFKRLKE